MSPRDPIRASRYLVALAALALLGCTRPATGVEVGLDTDIPADRMLRVTVDVATGSAPRVEHGTQAFDRAFDGGSGAGAIALPASFGLRPGSDQPRDAPVDLVVTASLTPGPNGEPAVVFRRRARFAFSPEATTRVGLFLSVICTTHATGCTSVADDACTVAQYCEDVGQTCGDDGACRDPAVVPVTVPPDAQDAGWIQMLQPDVAHDASDARDASDAHDASDASDASDAADACLHAVIPIEADNDDGEISTLVTGPSLLYQGESDALYIGDWNPVGRTWGFLQFRVPINLPTASVLRSATLLLWQHTTAGTWDSSANGVVISLESTVTPPDLTSVHQAPDGTTPVAVGSTTVRWPATGGLTWHTTGWATSPNLAPLLAQLITAQHGLAAGSHVRFWLAGTDLTSTAEVGTVDRSVNIAQAAQLSLDWCP